MSVILERILTCGNLERTCFRNTEFEKHCKMPNYHLIRTPDQAPILEIVNCSEILKQLVKMEVLDMEQCLIENEF